MLPEAEMKEPISEDVTPLIPDSFKDRVRIMYNSIFRLVHTMAVREPSNSTNAE